jgi:hemolysin activation/secretion protein
MRQRKSNLRVERTSDKTVRIVYSPNDRGSYRTNEERNLFLLRVPNRFHLSTV